MGLIEICKFVCQPGKRPFRDVDPGLDEFQDPDDQDKLLQTVTDTVLKTCIEVLPAVTELAFQVGYRYHPLSGIDQLT